MSDIEVGSKWITKGDVVSVLYTVVRTGANDLGFFIQIDELIDGVDCFTEDSFLRRFKSISNEQGRKDDSSKLRYSLLPVGTVNQVVQVLEFGSIKYSEGNWQKVPNAKTRYYDAALRHIDAWWQGEKVDSETGLPHLAHAICCLMFLMWFDSEATDD